MKRAAFLLSLSAFLIAIITLLFVFQLHPLQSLYAIGKASSAITGRDEDYYAELARVENTETQMKNLRQALALYHLDNGVFPETSQGLDALIYPPTTGTRPCCWSSSSYLEGSQPPPDAWGNSFVYLGSEDTGLKGYELISKGADQVYGTEDDMVIFHYGSPK